MISPTGAPTPSHVPKEWPTHPYTRKTAVASFVALVVFSLTFPYVSLPVFIGTIVTLAATGTVAATIDTIDAIAHERFWAKNKLQEAIDSRYTALLSTAESKILSKEELENEFKTLKSTTMGPNKLWQSVYTDIPRRIAYNIAGKPNTTYNPDDVFNDLTAFCGGDTAKARTLALLLHQGEVARSINPWNLAPSRVIEKTAYFVKIRKEGDKIEIQLWSAGALGSQDDIFSKKTTPKPFWGCVQFTLKESDLDPTTNSINSLERKIFYRPRRAWHDEATLSSRNPLSGAETLKRFEEEFKSPSQA